MKTLILTLAGASVALGAVPMAAQADQPLPQVCLKWKDGMCISTHRVKGTPPPYSSGYVFGPTYGYTTFSALPPEAVTYYKLGDSNRYVYTNGYIYVVDPTTYAVTRVINTLNN